MDKQNNNGKREIEHLLQEASVHMGENEQQKLKQNLQEAIAYLIQNDFEKLVQLLYRVDVDEKHLKSLLQQGKEIDATQIIAAMLIERQMQKGKMRQQFSSRIDTDDNEEAW